MSESLDFDFAVIGAGSAGCAAAYRLSEANVGTIAVLEAGSTDRVPQVKVPFGLLYTRGSGRDWKFQSTPQETLGRRSIEVTRGKMLGGSSSINSMVWFRGRRDDFDNWDVPGWRWTEIESDFEAVENRLKPVALAHPHPLSNGFARTLGSNGHAPPTPERESAGIFHLNLHNGARWSAADAFLRPAQQSGAVSVITGASVDKIQFEQRDARKIVLLDGRIVTAKRGILLCAGSIGSPAILMRSGIGPKEDLQHLGIPVQSDAPEIGANLHDHPAVGVHHEGPNSGYGLTINQLPRWALSPANWLLRRKGRLASNIVEAGAFFRAAPVGDDGDDRPDCQSHFIPFTTGFKGRLIKWGSGYSADVNVCRPASRGTLRLRSSKSYDPPVVDLGLLSDQRDTETLKHGVRKLRSILKQAAFKTHAAPEVYPGPEVQSDDEIEAFIQERCATAYHPVGTVRMGEGKAPISPQLKVRGARNLWVLDASIMPAITSANTNAPSMMIGYRGAKMVLDDIREKS